MLGGAAVVLPGCDLGPCPYPSRPGRLERTARPTSDALLALGVGVALIGFLPRVAVSLTYGLVVAAYVLDFVGGLLQLPEWVLNLSPFRHLTAVPAADLNVRAALVMLAIAMAAAVVGVFAFRRRDLQEA